MKRLFPVVLALAMVSVGVTTRADVKTQERAKATFEGMLGKMVGMFGGKSAKEGIVSTVAVKGDRMMKVTDTTGQIIDLAEEKVYDLDMKKKTYKVTTFEELRRQMEEARKKAEAQMKEEREEPEQGEAPEMEIDFDVKQTGQTKTIAGHATQEIVVTITTRQKGKTLEEGGGMVLATNSWLATDVPELKEIQDFHMRYAQKLGDVLTGDAWGALAGVGVAWVGLEDAGALTELRDRAREAGGIAPVVRGPGGLGDDDLPAAGVQRRLKDAFDPNGVLAPGRGWGGI